MKNKWKYTKKREKREEKEMKNNYKTVILYIVIGKYPSIYPNSCNLLNDRQLQRKIKNVYLSTFCNILKIK